jgi:thioredoxin-like negative regulator of GroEL
MAKPIVDGIERDLEGTARVIRLSVVSETGSQVAQRYGVRGVPTIVVLDGAGQVVAQSVGVPDRAELVAKVSGLSD